ncbi:MAG: hypothetical protein ACI4KJ_03015 [Anaerovoracaceae bacterium]
MRKRLYTENEVQEAAKKLAARRIVGIAVGGSLVALGAIAVITCKAVKSMSEAKAWNDVDWNLDEDIDLL